jgi:hypothetical protein
MYGIKHKTQIHPWWLIRGHKLVSATCPVIAGFVIGAPAWL